MKKNIIAGIRTCLRMAHKSWGLPLLYIGVAVMVAAACLPIANRNAINLTALALIYAGVAGYVVKEKRKRG